MSHWLVQQAPVTGTRHTEAGVISLGRREAFAQAPSRPWGEWPGEGAEASFSYIPLQSGGFSRVQVSSTGALPGGGCYTKGRLTSLALPPAFQALACNRIKREQSGLKKVRCRAHTLIPIATLLSGFNSQTTPPKNIS